jgi:hypothetical protein
LKSAASRDLTCDGDERQHLLAPLLHQPLLLVEGGVYFVVHPPTRQQRLRAAEQDFVPESDAAIHLGVDVVAGQELVIVEPAANASPLECVVQAAGEGLIGVAVRDEAGVELDGAPRQRWNVGDEVFGQPAAAEEGRLDVAAGLE